VIRSTDPELAEELIEWLVEDDRTVRGIDDDAQLASEARSATVLVAQAGPRLEAQHAFLRGPIIVVSPQRTTSPQQARRAYAIVSTAAEAALAVDRLLAHRQLAERDR
jgi:hypothetical protein